MSFFFFLNLSGTICLLYTEEFFIPILSYPRFLFPLLALSLSLTLANEREFPLRVLLRQQV